MLREEGPVKESITNPFQRLDAPATRSTRFKLVFGFPFAIVKLLLALLIATFGFLASLVLTGDLSPNALSQKPLHPFRRNSLCFILRHGCRLLLMTFGIWYIEETELEASHERELAARIIVSNHISYLDIFYHLARDAAAFVSKIGVKSLPIIGRIAIARQCIFIDREGGTTGSVSEILAQRLEGDPLGWPRTILFPEGTTTNGVALVKFRTGAFIHGKPLKPIVLTYGPSDVDPSYCNLKFFYIYSLLCEPWLRMRVRRLPVYFPSEDEKKDAKLFAENVRTYMANELGVEKVDLSYKERFERNMSKSDFPEV